MRSLALEIISEEVLANQQISIASSESAIKIIMSGIMYCQYLRHPTNGKTITEGLTESLDRHLSCKGKHYYVTILLFIVL